MKRGVGLIFLQTRSLLVKNFLLSWRNKKATALQLLSSLLFVALLFAIDKATSATNSQTTAYDAVKDPPALVDPPIRPCEDKFFIKKPCFDFLWSGNSSAGHTAIAEAIMNNNPGRPIPTYKVLSFGTPEEIDSWLLSNPLRAAAALHFSEINSTVISYGIQTNSTSSYIRGLYEDPTFKFQVPLQIAAEREIARYVLGDSTFSWSHGFKEFAHPAQPRASALGSIGPAFFLAFTMFGFVLQIGALVTEKELKLRQAMTITGLYDSAYWLSWIIWDTALVAISSVFLILFGMMFQFEFFKSNNFAVLFLFFFLFQLNMTGFGYMLSNFIAKSLSATTVGFSVFIISFFTQLITLFGFPYRINNISSTWRNIWAIFPPNLLAEGVSILVDATATPEDKGVSWNGRKRCFDDSTKCYLTINDMYFWFLATFAVWFTFAIYFDNIIPNASGMRKSLFYFLDPAYWTGRGKNKAKDGSICSCMDSTPEDVHVTPDDEDVLEEENAVNLDIREGTIKSDVAVQIQGLVKTYPGAKKSGCCTCKRNPPYHAVKGLSINFMKDQLFCLLGPNGAGKTTVINCLTGITPVSSGNALIYGHSVRSSIGMSNIRKIIGVCPQFDILWDALTGEEHIQLFASIKGMPPSAIKQVTEETLENVKLSDAAKVRTRSYSGGMRRRLSVAIALIGDPKLVILDEPTTGMDPISRRLVWDIIQTAKKGRAIILTTHSMEEADILNDRLGIMAKGRLRCIGTSIRLKSKFGTGFVTNVSFANGQDGRSPINGHGDTPANNHEPLKHFFKTHLNVVPAEENKSFMTFVIPREKEQLLTNFFAELQDRELEFGISDIQLGLATLEEVFLNIARQAEVESASEEGRLATLDLESGISVKVPVGARYVAIPGTQTIDSPRGFMVEVYWSQDDSGTLSISGNSNLIPLPGHVQLPASAQPASSSMFRRRNAPVLGIVLDTDQVRSNSSRQYSS